VIGRLFAGIVAFASASLAGVAQASPVTDCPNRDAPFSAQSPLVDLLLSPAAKAVLNRAMPGRLDKLPPMFAGTTPPTFAAILTLNEAGRFTGLTGEQIAAVDVELRALPVTEAEKVARCARYDNDVPKFELTAGRPRLLVFEKINGFKDVPSVNAAHAALEAMAQRKGWSIAFTDRGGVFNQRSLRQFDAVIWNNISGDVLTLSQRRAFQRWLGNGGAFVAVHGSAGDPAYFWDWYPDTLIGARFAGHPRNPQFQEARIAVNHQHPLAHGLPTEWRMTDEWYSFKTNPRAAGAQVILTLDESSYNPNDPMMPGLVMGADHPLAWTNCIGPKGRERGRMFYSAIGHRPETYSEPNHVALLEAAIGWAATAKRACPGAAR
jgi:type 1 glutamine amidotransferase